jgi:hypothetical protein
MEGEYRERLMKNISRDERAIEGEEKGRDEYR